MERAYQLVKHLSKEHPQGKWEQFLSKDGKGLNWDQGDHVRQLAWLDDFGPVRAASEGRPCRLCSRGLAISWRRGIRFRQRPTKTASCVHARSRYRLERRPLLPVVAAPGAQQIRPGGECRQDGDSLWQLAAADHGRGSEVEGPGQDVHGASTPGGSAIKGPDGKYIHEDVWKYLFLHPVEQVGKAVPFDPDCTINQQAKNGRNSSHPARASISADSSVGPGGRDVLPQCGSALRLTAPGSATRSGYQRCGLVHSACSGCSYWWQLRA